VYEKENKGILLHGSSEPYPRKSAKLEKESLPQPQNAINNLKEIADMKSKNYSMVGNGFHFCFKEET
jgi:hypothetical protein